LARLAVSTHDITSALQLVSQSSMQLGLSG
jgi:hypothetical protein